MKKKTLATLLALLILSLTATAFAGKIVTPNGGRAYLWRTSSSTGSDYVAYVSSGNSASKINSGATNNRFYVNAYGYNSGWEYAYYKGWINKAYYQD